MKNRGRVVSILLTAAAAIWGATVLLAVDAIRRFESTPGQAANARGEWPRDATIARSTSDSTLVMLIHPHCSCSRASVKELHEIITHSPASMRTYVLVFRPRDAARAWEQTDVYTAAQALPRATVVIDDDGEQSRRFGGFTSGQTFLYDAHGQLRYAGGVTSLRGHAGANRGRTDVIRLANASDGKANHPVFGCAILNRSEGGPR